MLLEKETTGFCPCAFSLSVVTESWLLAGSIATQDKDYIFQVSSLTLAPGWCDVRGRASGMSGETTGKGHLGTLPPLSVSTVWPEAAFATAILGHVVTLRMKFCDEDVGEGRVDDFMELPHWPQTAHLRNRFLNEWVNPRVLVIMFQAFVSHSLTNHRVMKTQEGTGSARMASCHWHHFSDKVHNLSWVLKKLG